jgi:hypothetical protein
MIDSGGRWEMIPERWSVGGFWIKLEFFVLRGRLVVVHVCMVAMKGVEE